MRKLVLFVLLAFALSAVPAAEAADNVAVGHSGWIWGNPQPQGNTLNDVAFTAGSGYAVGDDGTLLKTANSGLTWRGLATGVRSDLERVRPLDANVVFAGGGCSLVRSDDGGATFARLRVTASERNCPVSIASFSFTDPMTGFVLLSNGAVARTTDGGVSFEARAALPGTAAAGGAPPAAPSDVYFLSGETGIALAGKLVLRTTDGGASWSTAFTAPEDLNSVVFATATTGYATGDAKTLLKTTDGGVTWTPVTVPADLPAADLTVVHCAGDQPNLCLISTRQGNQVLRTPNGGNTITSVSPYAGRKVLAAAFNNPGSAAAVGQGGATAVSADGGKNWAPVGVSVGSGLERLRALPSGAVTVTGADGALARSGNGGADWTSIAVPTTKRVLDTSFPTDAAGFALDSGGALFKTVDGGEHWTPAPDTGIAGARSVYAPDASTVLLLGGGGLARSTDGGATFDAVGGEESQRPALSDYDRAGSGLVLYGPRALLLADAAGGSFKAIARPGPASARIARADFFGPKRGYVLNRDGRMYVTRSAGVKWSEIRTTGTARGYDMAWGNFENGYLAVDRLVPGEHAGYVLRTDNHGHTWRPQLVAPTPLRGGGLVATAARAAVALAGASQLLFTGEGGDRGVASALTITPSTLTISKPRRVKVTGRLEPSVGNAEVHLAVRPLGGLHWQTRVVDTNANGRFSVKLKIRRPSVLVARWLGDAERNGAASNVVAIRRG